MDAKTRLLAIHLMETIQKDPIYAQSLGIEIGMKEQFPYSMKPYLHAEGLTEL